MAVAANKGLVHGAPHSVDNYRDENKQQRGNELASRQRRPHENHWYKQAWPKPTATDRGEYKHANLKHSEHDAEICKATYVLTGNDSG